MNKQGYGWMLAALVLLLLAGWLALPGQGWVPSCQGVLSEEPETPQVEFPRGPRPHELERMTRRRTLEFPPPPLPDGGLATAPPEDEEAPARPAASDPVLVALSAIPPGSSSLVIEANVIRHLPIGRMLLACLLRDGDPFAELKEQHNLDLLEDLDRVAFGPGLIMISGHFAEVSWGALFGGAEPVPIGQAGTLFLPTPSPLPTELATPPEPTELPTPAEPEPSAATTSAVEPEQAATSTTSLAFGAGGPTLAAIWRHELLLLSSERAKLEDAIARLEGRIPVTTYPLDENQAYGEIYGMLTAEDAGRFLDGQPELHARFRQAVQQVALHLDARQDVSLVADLSGGEAGPMNELARALGGALSLARLQARTQPEGEKLAELLDLARIRTEEGSFSLELALPLSFLERLLGECAQRGQEERVPGKQ